MNLKEEVEWIKQFNEGRQASQQIHFSGVWDYTLTDIKARILQSRIFKREKNASISYWLGRMRGKGDIRKMFKSAKN